MIVYKECAEATQREAGRRCTLKKRKKKGQGNGKKCALGVSGSLIRSGRLHATVRDRVRSPFHAALGPAR